MQTNEKLKTFIMTPVLVILLLCTCQIWGSYTNDLRIIEGIVSNAGQFPYAVAFYYNKADGLHFCGGSIISESWILTAAHCIEGGLEFYIYLGSHNLELTTTNGLIVNSTTYVMHPTYNSSNLKDDIGLISLPVPVDFTDYIQPIELPTESLGTNENTVAVGWGSITDGQTLPSNLLSYVSLHTISNEVCQATYGEYVQDTMVCLTGTGNQGMCEGDSGGPLIQITAEGKNIHVGVATFYSGVGCVNEHPSGYTRTFEYVEWIRNITNITSVEPAPAPPGGGGNSSRSTTALFLPLLILFGVASSM